jgi:threonine/homoserine/homoserine lactone efflux protein
MRETVAGGVMDSRLVAFIGVAALLTIAPGPDMALVLRNALRGGRPTVLPTAAGICSGCIVWGAASSLGVAALLAASAQLYEALKLAGAAYLVFLGVLAFRAALRGHAADEGPGALSRTRAGAYRQGLLTNLLNPKVGVFYATFLPQFIAPGQPVFATSVALACIHAGMGLVWLTVYGYGASRLADVMSRGRVRQGIEAATGTVLVAFGLRLAADNA